MMAAGFNAPQPKDSMTTFLDQLRAAIGPLRQSLLAHPLYNDIRSPQALRTFMQHHVFAVWDFMSLLKVMQQRLCCVSVPWIPGAAASEARFVNEIVLGEETDDDGHGGHASHFELYHQAMTAFGAETSTIDCFLDVLQEGRTVHQGLQSARAPSAVQHFVNHTFSEIERGDICRIASAFTFGREDLLPDVFQKIVNELNDEADGSLEGFKYYLRRHIELDGDQHGPMAARLMSSLCGSDASKWHDAEGAAVAALQARLALWDGIHEAVQVTAAVA
jgi:hypothetical protein